MIDGKFKTMHPALTGHLGVDDFGHGSFDGVRRALAVSHATPQGLRSYSVTQTHQSGLSHTEIGVLIGGRTGPAIIVHPHGGVWFDQLRRRQDACAARCPAAMGMGTRRGVSSAETVCRNGYRVSLGGASSRARLLRGVSRLRLARTLAPPRGYRNGLLDVAGCLGNAPCVGDSPRLVGVSGI